MRTECIELVGPKSQRSAGEADVAVRRTAEGAGVRRRVVDDPKARRRDAAREGEGLESLLTVDCLIRFGRTCLCEPTDAPRQSAPSDDRDRSSDECIAGDDDQSDSQ